MADSKGIKNFTKGPILVPLIRFALPVLFALILQAMYGAVDLLVVGKYGTAADVSAVSTGSQLMTTITGMIASFSMGTTILLGQQIGQDRSEDAGKTVGASIFLFFLTGCVVTILLSAGNRILATIMHAPAEAYVKTAHYILICGIGSLIIIFYNLIGAIFRGLGDSRTPLITVGIACVVNIIGDLLMCGVLSMGTEGVALATVAAQTISVVISVILIRKKASVFAFSKKDIRFDRGIIRRVVTFGAPVAIQDFLVGISFLVIAAIVNTLGLIPSAGVGVAEKVCVFIMLIPSAFMQSLAAVVSQNYGAGKYDRAFKTLRIAIGLSIIAGVTMCYLTFFHGNLLAGIFSKDADVVLAAADYLKAYAIDCLLTAFLFCFVGFYNGIGRTGFVMVQGICGAFLVRVPLSFLFSRMTPVSLFRIGLATPCSTTVQIVLCFIVLLRIKKEINE
ncbi:MAG: MATE family efflux transporter [Lachnospiraceae bacterium]|nr:MATE family efflux transporter [Lachnospiraceae bacterium]